MGYRNVLLQSSRVTAPAGNTTPGTDETAHPTHSGAAWGYAILDRFVQLNKVWRRLDSLSCPATSTGTLRETLKNAHHSLEKIIYSLKIRNACRPMICRYFHPTFPFHVSFIKKPG